MSAPDTSPEFFQAMFQHSADPWNFAADEYEQHRYRTVIAALEPGPYERALEPGCSVGVLTQRLAALCGHVDASDFSASAVEAARQRCAHLGNVSIRCTSIEDLRGPAAYDLVVLSEIGYYFTPEEWQRQVGRMVDALMPGGTLLAAHWLGHSPDHRLSGDAVHGLVVHPHLRHEHGSRHPDTERGGFRLDRWRKVA